MDELAERVQALPAELCNQIYFEVFTSSVNDCRNITRTYLSPQLLRVDPIARAIYAQSYYGKPSVFTCDGWPRCLTWLSSLSKKHRQLLQYVRFRDVEFIGETAIERRRALMSAEAVHRHVENRLRCIDMTCGLESDWELVGNDDEVAEVVHLPYNS